MVISPTVPSPTSFPSTESTRSYVAVWTEIDGVTQVAKTVTIDPLHGGTPIPLRMRKGDSGSIR